MTKILAIAAKLYDFAGNPKTKNVLITLLLLGLAFDLLSTEQFHEAMNALGALAF